MSNGSGQTTANSGNIARSIARRFILIGISLGLTIAFGMIGFIVIEGYGVFDAFYMTLITITTVGYEEIHKLSRAGRVFNSFLILFGVSVMFFSVGAITQSAIELEFNDYFGKRRTKRMIDQLERHFIVCGYGRVGRHASMELKRAGVPFVIMDRSEDEVERVMKAGMLGFLADATHDESLRAAGIDRARGLISALGTDADNLFVILSAKTLNPNLRVVSRASEEEAEQKLKRAGADTVFAPFTAAGNHLAQALLRPHVSSFLDSALGEELDVVIEQVKVSGRTGLPARSLRDLNLPTKAGVIVLAIRKPGGQMIFNPPADTDVATGDFLIAMGGTLELRKLEQLLTVS